MGLHQQRQFQSCHRVLNRAGWSSRAVRRQPLAALLQRLVPPGTPIVVGLDDTIERRRGAKSAAKGIYRDSVRSSRSDRVKASGLRRASLQLLSTVPWPRRAARQQGWDDRLKNPAGDQIHPVTYSQDDASAVGRYIRFNT